MLVFLLALHTMCLLDVTSTDHWLLGRRAPVMSVGATILRELRLPPVVRRGVSTLSVPFVRTSSGIECVDPSVDSADQYARLTQSAPEKIIFAEFKYVNECRGIWFPTRHVFQRRLTATPPVGGPAITEDELTYIRLLIRTERRGFGAEWEDINFADCRSVGILTCLVNIKYPDTEQVTPLWSGYLQNTIYLLLCAGSLYSLAWIPRVPAARRARLLSRGLCPTCKYDIHSIAADAAGMRTCPECGSAWPADPPPKEGST